MIDIPIININDYHKLNEIGSGSFGIVYLVEDKKTYIEYAAKEELTEEYKDDSNSKSSLILTDVIFKSADDFSNFTKDNKSLIILLSLSISSAISTINSLYNSFGTFSWLKRESANTFIEVIGVFNS